MRRNELWESTVITEISTAVYVAPNTGKRIHKDRPFHGFVLNDSEVVRDYCFENGYIINVQTVLGVAETTSANLIARSAASFALLLQFLHQQKDYKKQLGSGYKLQNPWMNSETC